MQSSPQNSRAGAHAPASFFGVWVGLFFSFTAGILSDFAVPWNEAEILYELITISGLAASAWLIGKYPEKAPLLVFGGAVLSISAALYIQMTAIAPLPFILLRFGLSPIFAFAFWESGVKIIAASGFMPLTFCTFLSYAVLAVLQYNRLVPRYFGAICAAFCFLGALFLLLFKVMTGGEPLAAPAAPTRGAAAALSLKSLPKTGSLVALALLLLVLGQLFNSLDVLLYSRFLQGDAPGSHHLVYPASIFLIGLGYLLGGVVVQKKGLPVLFVASCVVTQVFLLIALVPNQIDLTGSAMPLYVLGTAGVDLCVILLPTLVAGYITTPLRAISGLILFRVLKLYLIPFLFSSRWTALPLDRFIIVLTILLALAQMLVVLYVLSRRKSSRLARAERQSAAQTPPPMPPGMTPREADVVRLLLAGKDRGEIADIMGISFSTVNKHCVSIYRKTNCSSHLELLTKYGRLYDENTDEPRQPSP